MNAQALPASILLVGKLEPPNQRIALAPRLGLLNRLQDWREHTLSLIVSPPGFGKTTLLSQWWRQIKTESGIAAWLTLDEGDAEPGQLIANIILSLRHAGLDVGGLETIAENGLLETSVRATLLELIARIRANEQAVVLVIDDYQLAHSRAADEIIETFVHRGARNLHLAISSRDRPSIHLSALIARGLVQTIGAGDLMLTLDESAALFTGMLAPEEHLALYARCEGWAVVSQLARIWMQRGTEREQALRDFSGRSGEIADYLSEQLLQDLPQELQQFLMEAAVFDRFCAALLDEARDRNDSAALLERLTHFEALLIPLDRARGWFRFHSLFGDFLRERLVLHDGARLATLHLRASNWLMRNGDLIEAVRQALRAGDTAQAIILIERAGSWRLIMTHGIHFVGNLLKLFTRETLDQHPLLLVVQAYLDIKRGEWSNVRRCLDAVRSHTPTLSANVKRCHVIVEALFHTYLDEPDKREQMARLDAFATELDGDDRIAHATVDAICAICAIALAEFDRAERYSRDGIDDMRADNCVVGITYCMFHLGEARYYLGDWREAENVFRESLELAEANFGKDSMLKAVAGSLLARLLYDRNRLAEANALIDASLDVIERQDGWFDIFSLTYDTAIRLAFVERGREAGRAALQRARSNARLRGLRELERLLDAWQLEQEAREGALEQACAALAEPRLNQHTDLLWRERHAWTIAALRGALAIAQHARALQIADAEYAICMRQKRRAHAAQVDALAALALRAQGEIPSAIERLLRALDFAEGADAVRMFLNLGPATEALLRDALNHNARLPPFSAQRAFLLRVQRELRAAAVEKQTELSSRELEVLRELCRGRSNKSIGRLLGLSENTVKFHLKLIYRKLQVESRTGALTAAQRLSLPLE